MSCRYAAPALATTMTCCIEISYQERVPEGLALQVWTPWLQLLPLIATVKLCERDNCRVTSRHTHMSNCFQYTGTLCLAPSELGAFRGTEHAVPDTSVPTGSCPLVRARRAQHMPRMLSSQPIQRPTETTFSHYPTAACHIHSRTNECHGLLHYSPSGTPQPLGGEGTAANTHCPPKVCNGGVRLATARRRLSEHAGAASTIGSGPHCAPPTPQVRFPYEPAWHVRDAENSGAPALVPSYVSLFLR